MELKKHFCYLSRDGVGVIPQEGGGCRPLAEELPLAGSNSHPKASMAKDDGFVFVFMEQNINAFPRTCLRVMERVRSP